MDIDDVADELYALAPVDFVAARNAKAKQAKAAGDKELAAQILAMAKPNQAGWLANQLARQHGAEIVPLVQLGAELREAVIALGREQLQEFTRQQRQLVRALVQQARRLAVDAGQRVSDDTVRRLEATLHAALVDPVSADLLLAGRLTRDLEHSGFGPGDAGAGSLAASAVKGPARKAPAKAVSSKPSERHLADVQRVDRELAAAQQAMGDATKVRDEALVELEAADRVAAEAAAAVTRLRDELTAAVSGHTGAEQTRRHRRASADQADKRAQSAKRLLAEAAQRRDKVYGTG